MSTYIHLDRIDFQKIYEWDTTFWHYVTRLVGLADIKTSSLHMMASFSGLNIFCGRKQLRTTRQRVCFFPLKSNSNHFDVWSTKKEDGKKQDFNYG